MILCAADTFLLLSNLGDGAFIDYDEATYAQVIRESENRGDFLSFTYLEEPWFDKPPLYFWLAEGSAKIFGHNEFALRLPAALTGILLVILVWHISFMITGSPFAAFLGGMALATNGAFIDAARQVRFDVPVTLFIMTAIYCFLRSRKGSEVWLIGIGISIGLGVLMKSVIGFLSLPAIAIISLFTREWLWLRSKWLWTGAFASLLIIVPWHAYEMAKFGSVFWDNYFGVHILKRFESKMLGGNVTVWTYFKNLFRLTEPWVLAASGSALWLALNLRKQTALRLPASFMAGSIFIFILFAISRTKLFYYLIPMYPLWSLSIAISFHRFTEHREDLEKKIYTGLAGVLIFAGLAGGLHTGWNISDADGFKAFTEEERKIGIVLSADIASAGKKRKIYAHNHLYWETLRYYSGGERIETLPQETPKESFYLITAGPPPRTGEARRAFMLYQGNYLALLKVDSLE